MTFRIFTNNRGKHRGVFMYSGFCDVKAPTPLAALLTAQSRTKRLSYLGEHGAPKAIEWPATTQESKEWLAKHVG